MTSVNRSTTQNIAEGRRTKSTESSVTKKQNSKWKDYHADDRLSGIEFRRSKTNELVGFVTIKHDEILDEACSYRIAIIVNDDDTFTLPPRQTFEEMIQAKRRQQMLLYGPGNSATNSTVLSDRAARRVASAARRQTALNEAISRQNSRDTNSQPPSRPARPRPKKSSGKSRSRSGGKKKPATSVATTASAQIPTKLSSIKAVTDQTTTPVLKSEIITAQSEPSTSKPIVKTTVKPCDLPPATSSSEGSKEPKYVNMIPSMKELYRLQPTIDSIDKKEVMLLLKMAPPGSAVMLSNGMVVKKSRRGGARAGAGRKRSRPRTNDEKTSKSDQQASLSSANTSSGSTSTGQPTAGPSNAS